MKQLIIEFLSISKPKRGKMKKVQEDNKCPFPLQVAIELQNLEMVKTILHFTTVEQIHPISGSYLHLAVEYENFDIFQIVFEAAKNKFPLDRCGNSPYDIARGKFRKEMMNYLIGKKLPEKFWKHLQPFIVKKL